MTRFQFIGWTRSRHGAVRRHFNRYCNTITGNAASNCFPDQCGMGSTTPYVYIEHEPT